MSAGDSSGSASSDSEDEQMEFESSETQLKELEAKLAENPNDYETHVKLIEMLRCYFALLFLF